MIAIKIDVVKKEIYEINLKPGIKAMYEALEIDTPFTRIKLSEIESLWIDDEGLIRKDPIGAFSIDGYDQVLSGHGLIMGIGPDGESKTTTLRASDVRELITWHSVEELPTPFIGFIQWQQL